MITTKQVRSIMRNHSKFSVYTNKTTGHMGLDRRVKCYYRGTQDIPLLYALQNAAGVENVNITSYSAGNRGITVKCMLA